MAVHFMSIVTASIVLRNEQDIRFMNLKAPNIGENTVAEHRICSRRRKNFSNFARETHVRGWPPHFAKSIRWNSIQDLPYTYGFLSVGVSVLENFPSSNNKMVCCFLRIPSRSRKCATASQFVSVSYILANWDSLGVALQIIDWLSRPAPKKLPTSHTQICNWILTNSLAQLNPGQS